jgi:hypothetical protein
MANSFAVIKALLHVVNVEVTALTADGAQTCAEGISAPFTTSPLSNADKSDEDSDSWVECEAAPVTLIIIKQQKVRIQLHSCAFYSTIEFSNCPKVLSAHPAGRIRPTLGSAPQTGQSPTCGGPVTEN